MFLVWHHSADIMILSETIEWIAMEFGTDIQGPHMMDPNDPSYPIC